MHVSVAWIQVFPHAFPVVQTLQQGPAESFPLHAAVNAGPLAAAKVSKTAAASRKRLQVRCIVHSSSGTVEHGSPWPRVEAFFGAGWSAAPRNLLMGPALC